MKHSVKYRARRQRMRRNRKYRLSIEALSLAGRWLHSSEPHQIVDVPPEEAQAYWDRRNALRKDSNAEVEVLEGRTPADQQRRRHEDEGEDSTTHPRRDA